MTNYSLLALPHAAGPLEIRCHPHQLAKLTTA